MLPTIPTTNAQPIAFHRMTKPQDATWNVKSLIPQFLHAYELAFEHPATGERMGYMSELPLGLRTVMEKLR